MTTRKAIQGAVLLDLNGRPAPAAKPSQLRRVDLGPVSITDVDRAEALTLLEGMIEEKGAHFCCFCDSYQLSLAFEHSGLKEAHTLSSAIFADGIALVLLSRLKGFRLAGRISGPGFMLSACERGIPRGWSHFFYGGAPGVAEKLSTRLCSQFPGLRVAGTYCPPFRPLTDEEEISVKRTIESSDADVLWVGLGAPKQELWMANHLGQINVPVMLGVGAAFDFHSGTRPWAPAWIRRIGMEWLYRAVTGGRKTFLRNLKCVSTIMTYMLRVALTSWPRSR